MNAPLLAQLKGIAGKLASEVVFAEAGKDNGLLPVNSFVRQLEDLITDPSMPGDIAQAVQLARRWVDEIFDATGLFTAQSIQHFHEFAEWLQTAVRASEQKSTLPAIPSQWKQAAAVPAAAAPAPAATVTAPLEEPTLDLGPDTDAELLREFINESGEHLQNIEQGVLTLEENPNDADTLNTIFRAFHTFKGGSGFLQLLAIQTLAHELESLLDQVRQHKLAITSSVINVILEGGDTLKQFVDEIDARLLGKKTGTIVVPTLQLLSRIRAVLAGESAPPEPGPESAPAPVELKAEAARVEAAEVITAPPAIAPIIETAPIPTPAPVEEVVTAAATPVVVPATLIPAAPRASSNAPANAAQAEVAASRSSVKVDTYKLDSLVDLVGELVIGQSLVVQNGALVALQDQQLARDLAQLGRITKELQRTAMSLRMVPIRSTFQKMNRLVRDTAARIGKQVELIMEGEDTELDRTIVEEISDPLIHMIRNAIDHGIEMPKVRAQRGKATQGTVWLRAFYQGGNIIIEIRDDGNGLDKAKLLAKAIEKGVVRPDETLSESEIFNLIFAAGFSTAEKVTDLSGRGVGMDVVRRNIEKLRGKVEIQSTLGQGSTFSISLPLTLAIIDGLIVGVGEHRYILPTLSVCESFRPTEGMIDSVHERGEMMTVRGRLRPVLRLYEHLGVTPTSTNPTDCIAVVVEAGKAARCILVDQLIGKQEVVIKSLGQVFKQNRSLSGGAILGDGRVGLILDPVALVELGDS